MFSRPDLLVCSRMFDEGIIGDLMSTCEGLHWSAHLVAISERDFFPCELSDFFKWFLCQANFVIARELWNLRFLCSWSCFNVPDLLCDFFKRFLCRASIVFARELWNLRFLCSWSCFSVSDSCVLHYCCSFRRLVFKFLYCFQQFCLILLLFCIY